MRVTNSERWQRTKLIVAGLLCVGALLSITGLDSYGEKSILPFTLFVPFLSLLIWLVINIIRTGERE